MSRKEREEKKERKKKERESSVTFVFFAVLWTMASNLSYQRKGFCRVKGGEGVKEFGWFSRKNSTQTIPESRTMSCPLKDSTGNARTKR